MRSAGDGEAGALGEDIEFGFERLVVGGGGGFGHGQVAPDLHGTNLIVSKSRLRTMNALIQIMGIGLRKSAGWCRRLSDEATRKRYVTEAFGLYAYETAARRWICTNFPQARALALRSDAVAGQTLGGARSALASAARAPGCAVRSPGFGDLPHNRTEFGAWILSVGTQAALQRLKRAEHMHKIKIPKSVVNRVVERCGTEHPHADLDPARTALVVVDLQNGFMMEGVAHALCKAADRHRAERQPAC